jgi:hypothetical protein
MHIDPDALRWRDPPPDLGVVAGDVIHVRFLDGSTDHLLVMDVEDDGLTCNYSTLSGNEFAAPL